MRFLVKILCFLIACFYCALSFAQQEDTTRYYGFKAVGVPVGFYSPETRAGAGAAGFFTFKTNRIDTLLRPSQIALGGAYTQERQLLTYLSFDAWWNRNQYLVKGELGYYDFFYYFWGVGGDKSVRESFTARYPQVRLEGYRSEDNALFYGLKFTFDDYTILSKEESSRLSEGKYLGSSGGKIAGLGLSVRYDTRNDNFFPTNGWNVQVSYEQFSSALGSDFAYGLSWINAIKYFNWKESVFALNTYGRFINGDAPFFHLSQIGGGTRMRGYYEGYYRDNHMVGWQAEYRSPLFWRFRGVLFAGNAVVAPNFDGFLIRRVRAAAGIGLRFLADRKRNIYIRFDYAFSKETTGAYFTLGEAY